MSIISERNLQAFVASTDSFLPKTGYFKKKCKKSWFGTCAVKCKALHLYYQTISYYSSQKKSLQ